MEDDINTIRELIIQCVCPSGLTGESWKEVNVKPLDDFILNTSIPAVVVYKHTSRGLQVDVSPPPQGDVIEEELCYVSRVPGAIITDETFDVAVQLHTVRVDPLKRLLQDISFLHSTPVALKTCKDLTIKNDYSKNLHCYSACVTDVLYKTEGHTVLYIPMEALQCPPEEASKDRKLVQKMETVMINWTDQIKELLTAQEIVNMRDNYSPLQEIEFWKSCSTKLSEVIKQLQKPEVRHIHSIVQLANSLYVQHFNQLAEEIQACSLQAQSNLTCLSILKEPCEELSRLKLREIPSKLRRIVILIRTIWTNSPHYNSVERITGLFCQLSNEIIHLCVQSISLDKIFKGYVSSSKENLHDCIHLCLSWKDIYLHVSQLHHKHSPKGWVLEPTTIFVMVDAFIRRLRDLLEVCDCQHQFARWEDGQQKDMPCISDSKLTPTLQKVEKSFHCSLQNLASVDNRIFDVKDPTWNNEFSRFCAFVKDQEIVMQDLINSAFRSVRTVREGVHLLDIFQLLSSREAIRHSLEEKAEDVYRIFNKELKMVHRELDKNTWSSPDLVPKTVGQVMRAKALRRRLDETMEFLQNASFLPDSNSREKVFFTYKQSVHLLDDIVLKTHDEWVQILKKDPLMKLKQPLLMRSRNAPSGLDINLDNDLVSLFSKVTYWGHMKFEISGLVPYMLQRKEDIRLMRERALLLLRQYNRIFEALSPDELVLFSERVHYIDRKMQPGLSKMLWCIKEVTNYFIHECLLHVEKVQLFVNSYNNFTLSISNLCQLISETLLVKIDDKTVYRNLEFEDDQKAHQHSCLQLLRSAHQEIVNIMTQIHSIFAIDGAVVQEHWVTYTERIDRMVEEAFRCNIRNSMKKLSRAINGENKKSPNPLLKVLVVLSEPTSQTPPKVEFLPSLPKLAPVFVNILPQLISLISEFKRLPDLLSCKETQGNPIHINIEQDEGIRKIQAAVTTGMSANASHMKAYLKRWDKYRAIWETNKDAFIQSYKSLNTSVSSFDADIQRYSEKANNVQQEETVFNIQFVTLDCSPLKSSIVQHCSEWQSKFTKLLSQMASSHLQELYDSMQDSANRVRQPPETMAGLDESFKLLETLQESLPKKKAQISLIYEQFAILDKYEVLVEKSVESLREGLSEEWLWFQQVLTDGNIMLQKHKEKFKNNLILSYEDFKKKIETSVLEFNTKGPFNSEISTDVALKQIAEHRIQVEALKQEENEILDGLAFFKIERPLSKMIRMMEKDINQLQEVWAITKELDGLWNSWKVSPLAKLQPEEMESTTQDVFKKLRTLQRDLKDKEWDIVDFSNNKIERFKKVIRLVTDLMNPAMRDRHYKQICEEANCSFDPTSSEFTLEKISSLGLEHYAEKISGISGAASKELSYNNN